MVYDERGNFVGDLHWQREEDFDEGEEVQLERGGVIVQVMECVGRQEQDLSELLDKRAKEKEQRQARVIMRPSPATASPNTPLAAPRAQDHFQTRHRPLNHLLGTPTGHHGRASVPNESPFELRQKANDNPNDRTESRPLKRRKRDITPPSKVGYAQSLFGATLSLSAVPVSSVPPRQPANSAHRPQSVTSSQEEVGQNSRHVRDDRGLSRGTASRASPSTAKEVVPLSRTLFEANRSTADEDNETFKATSRNSSRSGPVDAIQNCRQSTPLQPTNTNNRLLTSSNDGKPLAVSNRQKVDSSGSGRAVTTQNPRPTVVTNRTDTVSNGHAAVDPESGDSRSQAIVLNEDPESGTVTGAQPYQHQEERNKATKTRRGAPSNATKPSKRNKSLQSTTQLQAEELTAVVAQGAVDEPQDEERTELRLKPRQKRGLLLLSEKRNRPKRNKRQDALASGPSSTGKSLEPPIVSTATKPSLATGLETIDVVSMAQRDELFGPSPVAPEIFTPEPHPQRALSQGPQDVPVGDDIGCEITYPTPCTAAASSIAPAAKSVDQPELDQLEPSKPDHNSTTSMHGETTNLSHSPRRRRVASRGKDGAHAYNESNRPSSLDPEEPPTDLAIEPTISRPRRQTRKANLDEQDLGRSKKKARKEDPAGSDGEEMPRPRVKPRLAKLSRKSIRSREVFGFVPSSPPVFNVANTGLTTVSVGGFHSTANGSTGGNGLVDPAREAFPVPDGAPSSLGEVPEAQTTLPQKVISRVLSPPLPRHDTIPGTGSHERVVENKNTNLDVRGLDSSSSTPEKEVVLSTTTLQEANQEQQPVLPGSIALRSQLHETVLSLPEQPERPMDDISDVGIGPGVTRGATEQLVDAPAVGPTRRRITNPATRGRKAALKSDAAGQVPQSIVPVEPIPARRPPAAAQPEAATGERPKRKMRFPGFASVKGGGPWSREAHDLLENGRPG
ncbi:uncharacterized protein B0H64DRAFT_318415 [Chaetomium fimeti]|uniref:5'-3' DNA helicase ZGRF1-like N-terminal domain-containing protein n=1 Tax=Chaetomium fimeti TaxID=1854472 RepID=A0AAE0LUM5_9PEZI|nr:hypothetical protein B0H64DRAFT_318415 [Chaetomium fimeti]